MMNDAQKRSIKAKLYNHKSGIDGIIQIVEGGVLDMKQTIDAVGTLSAKLMQDLGKCGDSDDTPI